MDLGFFKSELREEGTEVRTIVEGKRVLCGVYHADTLLSLFPVC